MALYEIPAFVTEFDSFQPEISELESVFVTKKFNYVYDNLVKKYRGYVDPTRVDPDGLHDALHLEVPVDEESYWSVNLVTTGKIAHEEAYDPAFIPRKIIELRRVVKDQFRNKFSYSLCADDIVRRYDAGDELVIEQHKKALGEDLASLLQKIKLGENVNQDSDWRAEFHNAVREGAKNQDLEMEMRLNNQPIGIAEVDGLDDMLNRPDVRAGYQNE